MVSVCRSFGEKFVVSWWTESLECRRVRCPESRFVRSAENTINSLTVGGCSKTPPSRSGISELRHYDRTEHLLQGRLRHPMRPQDPDGVHGPCRRADDIIQMFLNWQFVSESYNAQYFQRMNALDAVHHRRWCSTMSLPAVLENDLDLLRCIQRQIIDLCPCINVGNFCLDCLHYRPVSPNTYHPRISSGYLPGVSVCMSAALTK